jgi:hypothetical protein
MGRLYEQIDERLSEFLYSQPVFFVATAPLSEAGHVNLSPKGLDGTFAILGPREVGYLDLTGSGIETVAHVRENSRITLMFCSFTGPPKIVRLYGRGSVCMPGEPGFNRVVSVTGPMEGTRAAILIELDRISDSCGFGVPRMEYVADRDDLPKWCQRKGPDGLARYQADKNAVSIDDLPGLPFPGLPV